MADASQEGKDQTINEEMCGESQQRSLSRPPILLVDPQPPDVMLARGKRHRRHPGNLRLLTVLDMHRVRYDHAQLRKEKTLITYEIVQIMQTCGPAPGRFLRFDSSAGGWYEVDDEVARVKVGNALRYARRNERRDSLGASSHRSEQSTSSHRSEQSDTVNVPDQAPCYQQATVIVADQLQRTQSNVSGSSPTTIINGELGFYSPIRANLVYDTRASPMQEEGGEAWKQKHSDLLAQQQEHAASSTIRSSELFPIRANLGYFNLVSPMQEEEGEAWKQKNSGLLAQQQEQGESSSIISGELFSDAAIRAVLGYDILGSPTKEEERVAWKQKYSDLIAQQEEEGEVWKQKYIDLIAQQEEEGEVWKQKCFDLRAQQEKEGEVWKQKCFDLIAHQQEEEGTVWKRKYFDLIAQQEEV
jgi:hypothetical protein